MPLEVERVKSGGHATGGVASHLSVIQRAVLAEVRRLGLPASARVLDAPCGAGALAREVLTLGFDVRAVDVDDRATGILGPSFVRADLQLPLPFSDQSFDAALCVEGIEHLENPFLLLREFRRVLRPDAPLVLTTPNVTGIRSRVRFLGSGFYHHDPRPLDESARDPMHHIGLRTFAELRYALATSGFRLHRVLHTHVKPVSLAYAPLAAWMALYTSIAFRKEKNPAQRRRNAQTRRALLSYSLLFGENLLLVARVSQGAPRDRSD